MVLWACLASKYTSCPLQAPAQTCGSWPRKQHSFKIKALKASLVGEQSGSMGFLGMWTPWGWVERGESSFPRMDPKWCWRIVSWSMGLALQPQPGQSLVLHPCPFSCQVGLWCTHPVFIMRWILLPATSHTAPHPPYTAHPREMSPSSINVLMESGQMTAPAQGWASNWGGGESWTGNFGRQLKD